MKDLLGDTPFTYPAAPGFKHAGTSRDAAAAVEPKVTGGRAQVLNAILGAGECGMTADEVAEQIGRSILYVRPRVSELGAMNKIVRTGTTRKNQSGIPADVWKGV